MKFNIGTGVALFLILFVSAMIGFVIFTSRLDVNMVHKDYYERGVDHSQQIALDRRSVEFAGLISIDQDNEWISIAFDEPIAAAASEIKLVFYRPSDSKLDRSFEIELLDGKATLNSAGLSAGRYTANVSWKMNGEQYEIEKMVIIENK